jgi:hypothetical protein
MAARFRVIILDKGRAADEQKIFRYVLWADVPPSRQSFYAQPAGTVSAWKDAIAADNAQIVNGSVTEKVDTINGQTGWSMPQYQAELQLRWQAFQDDVTTNNPWNRYGSTWNGTAWVLGGVA